MKNEKNVAKQAQEGFKMEGRPLTEMEVSKIIAVRRNGMDENLRGIAEFVNCRRWVWKKSQ